MWSYEPLSDEELREIEARGNVFVVLFLVAIFLALLFVSVTVISFLSVFASVGFWPTIKAMVDVPAVRAGLTLSILTFSGVLFAWHRASPRTFAIGEITFALVLLWVALGDPSSNRLTVALAILASSYMIASAIAGWPTENVEEAERRVIVGHSRIMFYEGKDEVASIPRSLDQVVYQISIQEIEKRLTTLEESHGDRQATAQESRQEGS